MATLPTPSAPEKEKPEKYIRTFAGDIKIVKEGGVPDLAPLAAASAPQKPIAAPPAAESPRQSAPMPPPPPPRPEAHLETYAGDFSERMKETHASTATVLAAEEDSQPVLVQSSIQESPRNKYLYIIAGVILLVAGAAGAYIAYTRYAAATAPVVPVQTVSAPIFVDEREQLSGTGTALLQSLLQSTARPLVSGTVRLLYIASTTAESVFSLLPLSAPDVVLRNINAEGSMAGVVNVGGSQTPFFILSVSSYSNTFAGMLSWEKTMPRDLAALFGASMPPASTATTTRAANMPPGFRDEVVSDHDVRIYRDETGTSLMLYGYWNQATLVIARDPSAFTEILQRLATSRTP
ncbi:hypothetical protein KGQ72_00495 [Patescibacteria group bacterium]|nr:hypothetical protein [Patescibacteria group bacterium]